MTGCPVRPDPRARSDTPSSPSPGGIADFPEGNAPALPAARPDKPQLTRDRPCSAVVRAHHHGGILKPATSTPPAGSPPGRRCRSDTPSATATPRSKTSIPEIWITPLGSMIPATVSTAPATRSPAPRRVRKDWARRITPMTANSAPVRIRLVRTCRANLGAPDPPAGPPDEPHTTRFCRCDRSLMHLAALCVLHGTPVRSHRPGPGARHFSGVMSVSLALTSRNVHRTINRTSRHYAGALPERPIQLPEVERRLRRPIDEHFKCEE